MKRVWGGRSLETKFGRTLPDAQNPYGESWEVSDREGDEQSMVLDGEYAGKSLNELWVNHREEVFGKGMPETQRFPLLIKILDAQSVLSVQVHPPLEQAGYFGGEPKTEMWYVAGASEDSKLYVGVKAGVTPESFKEAIDSGTVDEQIHEIKPKVGDFIHIESGRLHAIGEGLIIYEIQQNSDTTYRVFDWNRLGLDGEPRKLHVRRSLACIDFEDVQPTMDEMVGSTISNCPHFKVDKYSGKVGEPFIQKDPEHFAIMTIISGCVRSQGVEFKAGDFFLLPKGATPLNVTEEVEYLETIIPVSV